MAGNNSSRKTKAKKKKQRNTRLLMNESRSEANELNEWMKRMNECNDSFIRQSSVNKALNAAQAAPDDWVGNPNSRLCSLPVIVLVTETEAEFESEPGTGSQLALVVVCPVSVHKFPFRQMWQTEIAIGALRSQQHFNILCRPSRGIRQGPARMLCTLLAFASTITYTLQLYPSSPPLSACCSESL